MIIAARFNQSALAVFFLSDHEDYSYNSAIKVYINTNHFFDILSLIEMF